MRVSERKKPDAHRALREAGEVLSGGGRRLLLAEAMLICLMLVSVYVLLSGMYGIFDAAFAATALQHGLFCVGYVVLLCLLTLFVTLPLLVGLLDLARAMAEGADPVLADLFLPFSAKGAYRRALRLSWGAFWRMLFVVSAVAATCDAAVRFFAQIPLVGLFCGVAVLIEVVLWLMWVFRDFYRLATDVPDRCKGQTATVRRRHRCDPLGGARFWFAALPRLLLGLLTVGIYLLWDVLPRMCVAYFLYYRQWNEIIQTEE